MLVGLAYDSTLRPGSLGLEIAQCRENLCVTRVIPGSPAWFYGMKPGMAVSEINGTPAKDYGLGSLPATAIMEIIVATGPGDSIHAEMIPSPLAESPMKFYLWILGGTFALLGSVVVVRRPDLRSAWLFWAFSGIMAAALGAGPSAAGPAPSWARILEGLAVIGIGAVVLPFVSSLVPETLSRRWRSVILGAPILGSLLALLYGLSLLFTPSWYSVLQPGMLLYTSLFALSAVVFLTLESIKKRHTSDHYQTSIPLFGIGLGILPFVAFSVIPITAGWPELMPHYLSILFVVFIPATFAYAILQHQLLGIRRLVHRGMVHALATSGLFLLAAIGFNVVAPRIVATDRYGTSIFAGILVLAVILFTFLRRAARYVIDRFIYRDTADLMSFWGAVRHFSSSDDTEEVARAMTEHLVDTFNLESALLFLDDDRSQSRPTAQAGSRARETLVRIYPGLQRWIETAGETPVTELRWESDSLLVVNLLLGDRRLGNILLGPKKGGDVFLEAEKSVIAALAPVMSLGLGKTLLSEELRELNRRMISAQEAERARVSADIHDGPLQKATLLVAADGIGRQDRTEIARQLVQDLREVGSRLRPAILDDLGIVAAVDWLLEGTAKRHGISVRFQLNGIVEEARFDADVELALFRIAQEAVNNVVKHSQGSMLTVSLSRSSDRLILNVEDDGVGFDVGMSRNGGSGLSGMRERATHVAGRVVVTSRTGVGTLVTADVPMIELKYE